ncbi:Uncharacterized protein QTN25_000938 [Entamoeba marina]
MSDVTIPLDLPMIYSSHDEISSCTCLFCKMKAVILQNKYIPWITLARIFFLSLMALYPSKEYFSVKTDIPDFIHLHWKYLSRLSQFGEGTKWRKSMLDAINHSRYFESGKFQYHVSGYWKLKDLSVPFVENWTNTDFDIVEMSVKSESSSFDVSQVTPPVVSGSDALRSYYIDSIHKSYNSINDLVGLYPSTNPSLRLYIQQEIQNHQLIIQRSTECLYQITDCDNQQYSSSCLITQPMFQ